MFAGKESGMGEEKRRKELILKVHCKLHLFDFL